jgi:hypothetical protein
MFPKNKSTKFLHPLRNYKLTKADPSPMSTRHVNKPRHLPINNEKEIYQIKY